MNRLTKGLERAIRFAKAARRTHFTAAQLSKAASVSPRAARNYCVMLTKATILERAYTYPPSYRYTGRRKVSKSWEPILALIDSER